MLRKIKKLIIWYLEARTDVSFVIRTVTISYLVIFLVELVTTF
jgi:hypothetical protein